MASSNTTRKKFAVILAVFAVILASVGVYFVFFHQTEEEQTPESTEVVGYWEGMYHDEEIESARGNKVPKEDLDKVKNRSIARLEVIRGEPMQGEIDVKIRTREEFKEDNPFQFEKELYTSWSNTIWFGQLIVPGQVDIANVRDSLRGNQTLAYYLIKEDTLVLIVEPTEDGYVSVDGETLIHELTHAMQDQRIGLENDRIHSKVTTERQAQLSLIEGEARLVEELYNDRCGSKWSCFTYQTQFSESEYDLPGYQAVSLAPYEAGEDYMRDAYEEGGWEAVDDRYTENPPSTMSEVIYPEDQHPNKYLVANDIAQKGWESYGLQGTNGQDRLGMVSISSMLYHYQNRYTIRTGVAGVNQIRTFSDGGGYNYRTELTRELEYDSMVPYQTVGEQKGFVWTQVWESKEDANKFTDIYARVLTELGGEKVEDPEYQLTGDSYSEHNVYSGPAEFQGYFSIARNDEMIVITYAEEESSLTELRPPRSEPLAIKEYETEEYESPNYEITKSGDAEQVDSNEGADMGDYLTVIVFVICSIFYLLLSVKASKKW